jgi:UDP-N-acetylglucosamine:LPS N-acetylglucosamine transferase
MPKQEKKPKGKAWIVSVSIGLDYERTAYPLINLSPDKKLISANSYDNIPENDKKIWENTRKFYELISNLEKIPVIGKISFELFDQFQKIQKLYPKNENISPTFVLKQAYSLIQKGWGKHLIESLKSKNKELPFLTTFFIPAFMAEYYNYPAKICCVICDADISRSWVAPNPEQSRIIYFAPTELATQKLLKYGVKQENIFLTGYPLPKENLGTYQKYQIAKKNLKNRILNLDPKKIYQKQYEALIKKYLGKLPKEANHKLTIMFSIGGAGAQKEIVSQALKSLAYMLQNESINFIIASGTKEENKEFFLKELLKLRLGLNIDRNIFIISNPSSIKYFKMFNEALNQTDILWTKPSELSFYAGLGLPIIIAPPLGSHEKINEKWLIETGAGIKQQDPRFTHEWLFDLIREGKLAEAAMQGFIEIKKDGAWEIEKAIKFSSLNF